MRPEMITRLTEAVCEASRGLGTPNVMKTSYFSLHINKHLVRRVCRLF